MKEFIRKSYLRPWDLVIIIGIILVSIGSFLGILVFNAPNNSAATKQAILRVDGVVIETFDLKEDTPAYTYRYEDSDGDYNLIEIDGDRIRIKEANCSDIACVRRGWLSNPGETPIACLPHNLFITVVASDGNEDGSLIY